MFAKIIRLLGALISGLSGVYLIWTLKRLILESPIDMSEILISSSICIGGGMIGIELLRHAKPLASYLSRQFRWLTQKNAYLEDKIQNEICRRVLAASNRQSIEIKQEEERDALIEALSNIVDMSREDIEKIAEEVRSEYRGSSKTKTADNQLKKKDGPGSRLKWVVVGSFLVTYFLVRRGSPLYLVTGVICLVLFVKLLFDLISRSNNKS